MKKWLPLLFVAALMLAITPPALAARTFKAKPGKEAKALKFQCTGTIVSVDAESSTVVVKVETMRSKDKAAKEMKGVFGETIDLVEYKFTVRENIARCVKMGVAKLPSIYLDGELAYSSIIPSRAELEARIRALL